MTQDILIIDDEPDIRMLIAELLLERGMNVRYAGNAEQAKNQVQERRPSLIILDIWLQGSPRDGLDLLPLFQRDHPEVPIIVISGHATIERAIEAMKLGAYDFIEKPLQSDNLVLTVERAIETTSLKRENQDLQLRAGGPIQLVGTSSHIHQLKSLIQKISSTNRRVMISGPPGVGKEVVARLLHQQSPRHRGPLIIFNCNHQNDNPYQAQKSHQSIAQHLFGSESQAPGQLFSVGSFEQAHGGTLVLDEVSDMPLAVQSQLSRVLHENFFFRVGGSKKIPIDVRIISLSSKNISVEIKANRFLTDLFNRLNTTSLYITPLSERRHDIVPLAQHFLTIGAEMLRIPAVEFSPEALVVLQNYHWPGNIRQLRNTIEWLLIMCKDQEHKVIHAQMLPPDISAFTPIALKLEHDSQVLDVPLREAREIFEREYLLIQMARFNKNISRVASFVGMERSALHRKLKFLGIHGVDETKDS